jgi:aspartate/methionine/tyrosine aminotransferase
VFSRRAQLHRSVTPLAARLEQARTRGGLIDLTETNPTRAGLSYPWEEIAAALADGRGARYDPEPFGLPSAREAVAAFWGADPQDVLLTASTSEAYAFLFKLLCDPGDRVLAFRPGYPLVELLAEWESVQVEQVELHREAGWAVDPQDVRARFQTGARDLRAILAVSPANPTGQYLKRHELDALDAIAAEHQAALIADEVFAEYPRAPPADDQVRRLAAHPTRSLAFSLSGLSKLAGLPQLKLAWTVLSGPADLRRAARERLELLADLFLSAATPVQVALPALLALGARVRAQIQARLEINGRALRDVRPPDASWSILPAEAGWSAVLRLPAQPGAEARAAQLLDAGVWAQPGYLFDFSPGSGEYLVLSLLPEPQAFAEGLSRLLAVL